MAPAAGAGLPRFKERLRGGVYGSVNKARQHGSSGRDDLALEDWPPAGEFAALGVIHGQEWKGSGEPSPTIGRLA